jgi:hypothetical protein
MIVLAFEGSSVSAPQPNWGWMVIFIAVESLSGVHMLMLPSLSRVIPNLAN